MRCLAVSSSKETRKIAPCRSGVRDLRRQCHRSLEREILRPRLRWRGQESPAVPLAMILGSAIAFKTRSAESHPCGRSRRPSACGRISRPNARPSDAMDAPNFERWKLVVPHRDLQDRGLFLIVVLALTPHSRPALASIDLVQPGTFWVVLAHPSKPRHIRHFGFIICASPASSTTRGTPPWRSKMSRSEPQYS